MCMYWTVFVVQDLEVPDAPRIKAIEEVLSGKVCSERKSLILEICCYCFINV